VPQYNEYDWRSDALCKGRHVDLWYPPLDTDVPEAYYTISRAVCRQCPVWKECLDDGVEERWGLWGGLTPQERTAIAVENPKPSVLRSHGTWMRYRQGCRCTECTDDHANLKNEINIEEIPKMGDDLTDLEMLKFRLIQP
jgi:WhiB family transcriptional regulator, redox-sensing transcriptional regulator